ncbi:MAG TPA: O-antigen ligase family protein [Sedimentibacter sp.]|nr:O-antigen ligase family protein [Sedimentibacter sp.]
MKVTTDKIVNEKLSAAIFIQFTVLTIQHLVLKYFGLEGSGAETYIKLFSKLIVGIFFIRTIFDIYYREYKLIIFIYIFSATIFLINVLLFPQNINELKSILFDFFIMCLPCFLFSFSIDNYDHLLNTLKKHGRLIFIVGIFMSYLIIFKNLNIGSNNYSMSLSYYLLIPSLIYLYYFLKDYTFLNFLLFVFSTIGILLIGARGPILCIVVYIIVFIFNNIRGYNSKGRLMFYLASIFIFCIGIIFFNDIIYLVSKVLDYFNIYSRTINFLLNDTFNLSEREKLYFGAFQLIREHPLIGIGIAGDRLYFQGYVHNLFLELILNYGIILGFSFSIMLIYIFAKSIISVDKETSNFNLIFICLGVIPLMFSSSYLVNVWFWIYLGLILKTIFKFNKRNYSL